MFQNGEAMLELQENANFVVLIGMSGTGKSTLTKYITSDASLNASLAKGGQCIYTDKEASIGTQSQTSKTTVPNSVLDVQSGHLLIDCPGFEDTRKNPANDIAGAFFIKSVFETAKRIKILLVENHNSVTFYKTRDAFLRTLSHIARLIPDANKFIGSFGVVVTKVNDQSSSDIEIAEYVKEFINDTLIGHLLPEREKIHGNNTELSQILSQLESEITLAEVLLRSDTEVGVFRTPCKSKDRKCLSCTNLDELRKIIFQNMRFAKSDSKYFRISVSDASANFMRDKLITKSVEVVGDKTREIITQAFDIADKTFDSVDLSLREKTFVLESERTDLEQFLESFNFPNGLSHFQKANKKWNMFYGDKIKELAFEVEKLKFFYECIQGDFNAYTTTFSVNQLMRISEQIDKQAIEMNAHCQIKDFLISNVYSFQQLEMIKYVPAKIDESSFLFFLDKVITLGLKKTMEVEYVETNKTTKRFLQQVNKSWAGGFNTSVAVKNENHNTIIEGQYMMLCKVINKISSESHTVYLITSGKLFVDCDLNLHNSHLIIVSPAIEVVGTRKIQMTGEHANNYQNSASSSHRHSIAGSNGAEGSPGFSSGSIRIFTQVIKNGKHLTLSMTGGNGGDGQNGGNGYRGEDSRSVYAAYDIVRCIFDNDGDGCHKLSSPSNYIEVLDYTRKDSVKGQVISHNSISPTRGGNGGDGGSGGHAGAVKIVKMLGDDPVLEGNRGRDGHGGLGGSGGRSCARMITHVKCDLYLFSSKIDNCWKGNGASCNRWETLPDGIRGSVQVHQPKILYFFKELSSEQQIEVNTNFLLNLIETSEHDKSGFNNMKHFFDLFFIVNDQHPSDAILKPYFIIVNHIAKIKLSHQTKLIFVQKLYKLFRIRKERLFQTQLTKDVLTLEAVLLSYLDVIESAGIKKVIFKVKAQLESFKESTNELIADWRYLYKSSALEDHSKHLQSEINSTKQYSKIIVATKIEVVEKELKEQFYVLVYKINETKDKVKQNSLELQRKKEEIAQNFWKRILFGTLRLVAGVATIFQPAVGASLQMAVSMSENSVVKDSKINVGKVVVPNAVANVRDLLTKFQLQKLTNAESRLKFQFSIAEDALQLEKNMGRRLFSESTRNKLQKAVDGVDEVGEVELMIQNLKNALEYCHKELEQEGNTDAEVVETMKVIQVARHASVLSAGVISDLRKVQRDAAVMDQINEAIEDNKQTMIEIEAFEKCLFDTFEPYLADMRGAFEKFSNDTEGMAQHLLIFRQIDLQKMTRQFTTLIRKFTDGFMEEQQEIIGIVDDLEALAIATMNAQTHVNDLEYKLQLASLIDIVSKDGCYDSKLCPTRIKSISLIKTNALLQKYGRLESAFQQAIFPFSSRQSLVPLQPGSDDETTVSILKQRVEAMVSELTERDGTIDVERDRDLRVAEFNSKFSASTPFYQWHSASHSEQISRLLRGERVTFVADVRHQRTRNAVKFERVGVNVTVPGVDLKPLLNFLELEMTHAGENHFRCGDRFYAIGADPLTFRITFERDEYGMPVSQNAVASKFSRTDVPFSPYTAWTLQLKPSLSPEAQAKFKELARYSDTAEVELYGRGTYVEEGASVCEQDLSQQFDLFL